MQYRLVEHIHGPFEVQVCKEGDDWKHLGVCNTKEEALEKIQEKRNKGFVDYTLIHDVA